MHVWRLARSPLARSWAFCGLLTTACQGPAGEIGPVHLAETQLFATPSETLVALPDGRVILESGDTLVVIDPAHPERDEVVIGPATEVGEVHAAVETRGAILVLAASGTFILRDASWVPSPLGDALDGPIRDAVRLPTRTGVGLGALWIVTDRSLYRVMEDGELGTATRLALDGDLADAQLAVGPRPEGPALWVRLPDRVLEVWQDITGAVRSASLVLETPPEAIGGDAAGNGWLVIDGRLYSMRQDRTLVDRGLACTRLISAPESEAMWAFDASGQLFLYADGALHHVEDVTLGADDRIALRADGSLIASRAGEVRRYAPWPDVVIDGPSDGELLATPQTFLIRADGAPVIEAIIGDTALEVQREPTRIELDPATLGEGTFELVIRVRYDDGTLPYEERRGFAVITDASWTDDVAPLYEEHCAACHGVEGPANTRLDARERWEEHFDLILTNLTEGRMPLGRPPLGREKIAILEAWRLSGYAP